MLGWNPAPWACWGGAPVSARTQPGPWHIAQSVHERQANLLIFPTKSVSRRSLCVFAMSSAVRIKAAAVALAVVLSLATASGYAATYALSVSASSNRSGAIALQGPTLAGDQYIFTSLASALTNYAPPGIKKVCYWLDNVAMSGTATHCETGVPYDYAGSVSGSSNSAAKPWNTTQVANGTHSITQLVTLSAGGTETDTANFTVANSAASVQALGLNPSTVTGGQPSTATVTL